jgi:hypothetical protein
VKGNRATRIIRIVLGAALVLVGVVAMLDSPSTKTTPRRDCGTPAIVVMFDRHAASADPGLADQCQAEGSSQVLGSFFFLALPGAVMLAWPRLRRLRRRTSSKGRSYRSELARGARPSRLGPRPVELVFTSPLVEDAARTRLEQVGNGGPQGALRVQFGDDGTLRANLVAQSPPRFTGELSGSPSGCELRGFARPARDDSFRFGFLAIPAAGLGLAAAVVWVTSTLDGTTDLGTFLLLLGLAALCGLIALGTRRLTARTFPLAVNRLSHALATPLQCDAPQVATRPFSAATAKTIMYGFVGLQVVLVLARISLAARPVPGFFALLIFVAVVVVGLRAARRWKPHLDGSTLQVGFRVVDLDRISEVTARGAVMALSDERARVVISSAFGRPETAAEAATLLDTPPPNTPSGALEAARIAVAIDAAVSRCPLDEPTAAALHRSASLPHLAGRPPRIDPFLAAPSAVFLAGFVAAFVAISVFT